MQTVHLEWEAKPMLPAGEVGHPGVYVFVLKHAPVECRGRVRTHTIYYVGQATEIGGRWDGHERDYIKNGTVYYPESVEDFLTNPVDVINMCAFIRPGEDEKKQKQCREAYEKIFDKSYFCYAIPQEKDRHLIAYMEYTIQECVKDYICITKDGWIGDVDTNLQGARKEPPGPFEVKNTFASDTAKNLLKETLPTTCQYPLPPKG